MDVSLLEFVSNSGTALEVDLAAGIARNVKLLGPDSANGRHYPESAMREALPMYEGAAVFLNHKKSPSDVRQVTERFGEPRKCFVKGGSIYAEEFHFNPKHSYAEQFGWDAQHAPHRVGFSHDIAGKTSTKGGKVIVESISRVNSIDLVAQPATTKGLYEHIETGAPTVEITLEQVKAQPSLVEAILAEHKNSEATKARDAEFQKLKEEVDGHRAAANLAAKKTAVAQAIAEAKLPKEAVSDTFVELCEQADESGLAKLIADRVTLSKSLKVSTPQSKEQGLAEGIGALPSDSKALASRWA